MQLVFFSLNMYLNAFNNSNTALIDAAKMEVGLLCWAYFFHFWEGCRICGFHIRKKIQVPYDSYLVLSDNDFASTGIFANQD